MEPQIPDIEKMRNRLLELILEYAFQYSETPTFKLAHGGTSQFYFNCKRITLDPEGQYLVGNLVFDAVKDLGISAIGGLTLGGRPDRERNRLQLMAERPAYPVIHREKNQ